MSTIGGCSHLEPGEDWFWCDADDLGFELDVPPGPSP